MKIRRFIKIFSLLFLLLIGVKLSLCAWRIYIGIDQLSLGFYLERLDWQIELLKIAFLAFLAALITFFRRS